jgi:hypothetical protein
MVDFSCALKLYAAIIHPLSMEHFDSRLMKSSQTFDLIRVMVLTDQSMHTIHQGR